MRKLHINDTEWSYSPGKQGVKVRGPNNFSAYVGYQEMYPDTDIERAKHKGNFRFSPQDLKDFIQREFIHDRV